MILLGLWCANIPLSMAAHFIGCSEVSIGYHFSIFRNHCIELLYKDLLNNKLGGPNIEVQVDESLFGHAKYHIGKNLHLPPYWVFGIVDNSTGKVFMCNV